MKQGEIAAKMFNLHAARCPDSPLGYNNLGGVQSDMGHVEAAIETLRAAIYRIPNASMLWNSLATVLAEDGRVEESLVFYNEAVRLDPDFTRLQHNLGYAYSHLGELEKALACYDFALEHGKDPSELLESAHSRSICLIHLGRIAEGFAAYESRNNPRFRAFVNHMIKAPQWKGESLRGKRIAVIGEQGLGDEFMFANILPDLQRDVGENGILEIAVDPRLVTLFQRSFPRAKVGSYEDRTLIESDSQQVLRFVKFVTDKGEPDFWIQMGSALQYYRKSLDDFPRQAFLRADPARIAQFRTALDASGRGPFVGICWRSMMLGSKRAKYYSPLEAWAPILKTPGVTFVNLQYGDCTAELTQIRDALGVNVNVMDVDLKDDIDGAAALSSALDLVISAPTASAATAGAVGTEVWFVAASRTWPQLGTSEFPWYRKTEVFSPKKFGDWSMLMPRIADRLRQFAVERQSGEPGPSHLVAANA